MNKILENNAIKSPIIQKFNKTTKSPIIQKFLSSSPLSPQNIEQLRKNIRQECKLRLKNKRRELFNKSRSDLENLVSNEFQKISINFYNELNSSGLFEETDIKVLQKIEQDTLNEQLEWFNEELTRIVEENENIEDQYSRLNGVVCPLCLSGTLAQCNNAIVCNKCNSCIAQNMQLEDFQSRMDFILEQHQAVCSSMPSFTLVPNEFNSLSLLVMCMTCQNCCSI
uniref:RPA-interacting protein C-terminal domain-containing protein n=1 Tax=Cacopsylla melanoneura TaxID=428564 RepID=A0A8D8LPS0_9HEMI